MEPLKAHPAADALIFSVTEDLSDQLFNESGLTETIRAACAENDFPQTSAALEFAQEKHAGQFRKPGHSGRAVPYIYHPLLMACHALALGLREDDLLAACLLHDVCEDCGVSPEELPVGKTAREAVRLLTKPADFDRSAQAEQAYYGPIAENRIAAIVKLLDRCNNVSGMAVSFTDAKMAEYIKETQEYVLPLLEKVRHSYPEYAGQLFLIRYHMTSVTEALRHHMLSSMLSAGQAQKKE